MVYKCFDKKTADGARKNKIMSNKESAEDLRKPIIEKFRKRKVHSSFIDNFWSADVADMQLINKWIDFLLCAIDVFSKYIWVLPLKYKKDTTITNEFQKVLD